MVRLPSLRLDIDATIKRSETRSASTGRLLFFCPTSISRSRTGSHSVNQFPLPHPHTHSLEATSHLLLINHLPAYFDRRACRRPIAQATTTFLLFPLPAGCLYGTFSAFLMVSALDHIGRDSANAPRQARESAAFVPRDSGCYSILICGPTIQQVSHCARFARGSDRQASGL
jgi:hypothetical protein